MTRFDEAVRIAEAVQKRDRTQWIGREPTNIEVIARELLRVAPMIEAARLRSRAMLELKGAGKNSNSLNNALEATREFEREVRAYLESDDAR